MLKMDEKNRIGIFVSNKRPRLSTEKSVMSQADLEHSKGCDAILNENICLKKSLADKLVELASRDEIIARLQLEIENLKQLQQQKCTLKG